MNPGRFTAPSVSPAGGGRLLWKQSKLCRRCAPTAGKLTLGSISSGCHILASGQRISCTRPTVTVLEPQLARVVPPL